MHDNAALIAEGRAAVPYIEATGAMDDAVLITRLCDALAEREGFVLVPREPTKQMLDAGMTAAEDALDNDYSSNAYGDMDCYTSLRSDAPFSIYSAMIAVAGETGA